MTTEEKLQEMENSMEKMDGKLDEVLHCLKGNDMGQVGLVARFKSLEDKVQAIEDSRVSEKTKAEIYMGIIKWLAGIIAALVIAYMFNQAYK